MVCEVGPGRVSAGAHPFGAELDAILTRTVWLAHDAADGIQRQPDPPTAEDFRGLDGSWAIVSHAAPTEIVAGPADSVRCLLR